MSGDPLSPLSPPPPPPPSSPPAAQPRRGGETLVTHDAAGAPLVATGATARRFLVLAAFCAFGINNQIQMVAFANIIRETQLHFDSTAFGVNMLNAVPAVVYVFLVPPGAWLLGVLGLRRGLLLGNAVNLAGAGLKVVAALWIPAYWPLLVSQVLVAVAQVFFLSVPAVLSAAWFQESERSVATAVAAASGFAGPIIAFALAPNLVTPDAHGTREFGGFFGAVAGWALLALLATAAVVIEEPAMPPSLTSPAALRALRRLQAEPVADAATPGSPSPPPAPLDDAAAGKRLPALFWAQRRNVPFISLGLIFGAAGAVPLAFAAVLAQVAEPFGATARASGYSLSVGIACGCVSSIVAGLLLDRWRRYRRPLIAIMVAAAALLALFAALAAALSPADFRKVLLYAAVPLISTLVLPVFAVGQEFSVELTYPLPEVVPTAYLMMLQSLFVGIEAAVAGVVLGEKPEPRHGWMVMGGAAVIMALGAAAATALVKENLYRRWSEEVVPDGGGDPVLVKPQRSPAAEGLDGGQGEVLEEEDNKVQGIAIPARE